LPVVLCTGFSELINGDRINSLGIDKYVMKPLTVKELANAVRDVLDNNQSSDG